MPDVSKDIRSFLLSVPAISSAVGTRIFPDIVEQNADFPAIRFMIISTTPYEHLSGILPVAKARLQIDAYGDTRTSANSVADLIRIAIEKFRGTINSQFIHEINLATGEAHTLDPDALKINKRLYVTSQDFFVTYKTTTS